MLPTKSQVYRSIMEAAFSIIEEEPLRDEETEKSIARGRIRERLVRCQLWCTAGIALAQRDGDAEAEQAFEEVLAYAAYMDGPSVPAAEA